jgi:hypothetical protein
MTKLFKTLKKPTYAPLFGKPIHTNVDSGGSKYGPKISSGFFGLSKGPVTSSYKKARNSLFTKLNNHESLGAKFNTLKQASGGSTAVNNILSGKRKLGGNNVSSKGFEILKKSYNNYALTHKDYSYTLPNLSFEQYVRYSQPDYKPINMFNTKELNKFRKTLNQRKTNPYAIATKIALNSTESKLPLNANNTTIANRISNLGYVPTPNVIRALREYKQ